MNKLKVKSLGFTLIELLIVIALLGALAVAMIAAIDPLEQFKRGQDTGVRNTCEEIYNAAIRYYSLKAEFPWEDVATGSILANSAEFTDDIAAMIVAGELKEEFVNMAGDRLGEITVTADADSVAVCYQPTSKGLQQDENTKWTNAGELDARTGALACISNGGTAASVDCYWCLK